MWPFDVLRQELLNATPFEIVILVLLLCVAFYLATKVVEERRLVETAASLPPLREKPTPRPYTMADVAQRNGQNGSDIWLCVKGRLYDVSSKPQFYGPEGPYGKFAGRDATRAFALTSLEDKDIDNASIEDIDDLSTLNEWIHSFDEKYDVVGWVASKADVAAFLTAQDAKESTKDD